jgi:hypothetical protein
VPSSPMLREGARPESAGQHGSREYRVTQNVYGKGWWEEASKELTDTCHGVFAIALNVQNA